MLTSGQCIVLDLQNNSADDELRPQVLVADEDSNRALQAANALALIAREAGDSLEIQVSMWRFDSFNSPTLREPAARHAHHRCRTREQQRRPVRSGHIVAGRMDRLPPTPYRRAGTLTKNSRHMRCQDKNSPYANNSHSLASHPV